MALDTLKQMLLGLLVLAVLLIMAGYALSSVGGLNLGAQLDAKKIQIVKGYFELDKGVLHVKDLGISYTGKKPVIFYPVFKIGNVFENKDTDGNLITLTLDDNGLTPKTFDVKLRKDVDGVGTITMFFYKRECSINNVKELQNCARLFISSDSVNIGTGDMPYDECYISEPANKIFNKKSSSVIKIKCEYDIIGKSNKENNIFFTIDSAETDAFYFSIVHGAKEIKKETDIIISKYVDSSGNEHQLKNILSGKYRIQLNWKIDDYKSDSSNSMIINIID